MYHCAALKAPFSGTNFSELSYKISSTEPDEIPEDLSEEFRTLIKKSLTKNSKERPTAMELCLCIPSSIINNYNPPKVPTLASLTFMNPTKATIEREKTTSKTELKDLSAKLKNVERNYEGFYQNKRKGKQARMEALEPVKQRKTKYKTPKRYPIGDHNGSYSSKFYLRIKFP